MWTPGEDKKPEVFDDLSDLEVVEVKVSEQKLAEIREADSVKGKVWQFLNDKADCNKGAYVAFALIIANVIAYIFQGVLGSEQVIEAGSCSWPKVVGELQLHRLFTCLFLHENISHLLGNMLILGICAVWLEQRITRLRLLGVYFIGGLFASISSVVFNHVLPMRITLWSWSYGKYTIELYDVQSIGASGAIAALLSALLLYMLVLSGPMDGYSEAATSKRGSLGVFGAYLLFCALRSIFTKSAFVDTAAHLGGFIAGIVIMLLYAWREYSKPKWLQE
ncbi:MAG: rhomboid family intramembrane serine protease [Lachnospiraceae bacterium]|nr:rhomboid family intramembrane serine protease [Lachnospiraceae bacterium]